MFGTIALSFFSDSESDNEAVKFLSKPRYYTKLSRNRRRRITKDRLLKLHQHNMSSRLHRRILRDATNVLELPEEQFIRNFRVNKFVFSKLLDEIAGCMPPTYRSTHVPAPIKLSKFLEFIATGVSSVITSAMSKSQVSRTVCEMLDIFEQELFSKWVVLEQNEETENLTKQEFQNICGIPGIVGCVDNTHIRIKTPDKDIKDIYNNVKGFHSLNVMMICDHNMAIKYVDPSQPGSYHDAYVWEESTAANIFRSNYLNGKTNTWLVGDSAYNLLPYMMIPYRNPTEEHQKLFNEKLSKTRDIIKQCISTLKKRFSCLITPKGLYYRPEKVGKIVMSCCILHNICIAYNDQWQPTDNTLEDTDDEDDGNDSYDDYVGIDMYNDEYKEYCSIRDEISLQSVFTTTMAKNSQESNSKISDHRLHFCSLQHATHVLDFPDHKYMSTFGVNKEVFSVLLDEIKPKLRVTYRITHTPAPIKLALFLEYIATGALLAGLEHEYTSTVSKSQMSKVVCEMLDIFEEHLYSKWIKLEQTEEEENAAKEYFHSHCGLPGVIGCVDNLHVQIKTPAKEVKKLYFNHKNFYSLNVMMICDHNMIIKYVDAYQPGSFHDAYVWDQSSAENYFSANYWGQETNSWLIGDCAHKLQPYLMIPYKNPIEACEYQFNQKHYEAKKIIKTCFGILKNRFKILVSNGGLQYIPHKASKIIITCCILHNICIHYKNEWPSSETTIDEQDSDDEENIIESPNIEYGKSIRNEIARYL